MRILKKLMIILMVIISLFSLYAILPNEANAATYLIKEANLYSKGEFDSIVYNDTIKLGIEFVVYKKDGVEYPAYCINRELIGVTTKEGATITVEKTLDNVKVWRVITNGYPFKTAKELNCNSNMEAFAATKLAVYDALYDYDWADFQSTADDGERVLKAAQNIAKVAEKSKATKISGKVEVKQVSKGWEKDSINEEYISKTYEVKTNAESTEYTIKIENMEAKGYKLTDAKNQEKTIFKSGETFKILIPITELETKKDLKKEFKITATANLKTMPILYGETADSNYQDYATVAGEYEWESGKLTDSYSSNKTCIKILKEDAETGEKLAGAKFNILDKNKNVVYVDVITNKSGIAEIKGIMPGKYFVEEIQPPEGYSAYEKEIEVDVGFNETYTVKVNNYKKPEEEEKEVETVKEITVTSKKEVALPRTGF